MSCGSLMVLLQCNHSSKGHKMTSKNGCILYKGPSLLDGKEIVVIATGLADSSKNTKTGNLIQTWIMVEGKNPLEVSAQKEDGSICGDCPHRRSLNGACYVSIFQAPNNIWKSYKRGNYEFATEKDIEKMREIGVRAGSYGDPAAVPLEIWETLQPKTGYTHQWRWLSGHRSATKWQNFMMASCDSLAEREEAAAKGWRCFVTQPEGGSLNPFGLVTCPATTKGVQCSTCKLCQGNRIGAKSVAIPIHGPLKSRGQNYLNILS